jgi:thiamine transport system permease protein
MDPVLDGAGAEVIPVAAPRPERAAGQPARRSWPLLALWLLPVLFLGLFYFYPLFSILGLSFNRTAAGTDLWAELFAPHILRVIGFTFFQATLSTLLTLLLGLPGAYLMARYDFRGKSLFRALTAVPFVMPTLVVAAAFAALLGPNGWINLFLMNSFGLQQPPINFLNTLTAILVAHVFYNTTIVLRMVGDFWSRIDPRLGLAGRTLGANTLQMHRRITLPLLAPAILAAALLVFIFDFTSFGVILILGGPQFATIEVEIYTQTTGLFNLPLAAALSVVQLLFTLLFTVIYTRLSARNARALNLRQSSYTQKKLRTWQQKAAAGALLIFLSVLLILPMVALVGQSFTRVEPDRGQRGEVQRGFTLEFYRALGENRRQSLFFVTPLTAVSISLGYALLTVVLSLLLGIPAAWALARGSPDDHHPLAWINQIMDPLLMLPIGTSAVTLGLGFLVALDSPPLDLRASLLLVPLAHTLVAFPFVVRSMTPALRSVQPRLRSAAAILGAAPPQVVRYIDLPLVGRAFLVAATFAFTISLGEFGATALLARPEYPTVPIAIYRFLSRPGGLNYGQALALSTILMVVCVAGMLSIERLRVGDIGEF